MTKKPVKKPKAMPLPSATRRVRGFEAASSLVGGQIRAAGEARGFAVSRLLTHWAEIAGPEIAAQCRPVKIGYGKGGLGGTLTLLTTGAAGPMLQMELPRLREKVNACYGYNAIARIVLTQTAPMGFSEGQAEFTPAPPRKAAAPAPEIVREAGRSAAGVQDASLRAALEKLACNILVKTQKAEGNQR